jgi:hypothetical protein
MRQELPPSEEIFDVRYGRPVDLATDANRAGLVALAPRFGGPVNVVTECPPPATTRPHRQARSQPRLHPAEQPRGSDQCS